jgi:aromatic-L-amino-acid decarboxylase
MKDGYSESDPLAVDPETMRRLGEATLEMLVEQLKDPGAVPLVRGASPEDMRSRLGGPPPEGAQDFSRILQEIIDHVVPTMVRGDHPGYMAFIPGQGTWPGALGDFIASALNLYGGSWKEGAGPSQLELTVLDWFKSWIGYPQSASGNLVSGGSAANMTALACARESRAGVMSDDLVLYLADQAHSSMARAARILGFRPEQVRVLPVDDNYRMRPDALIGAIRADRRAGHRPFFVGAAAGSTNTGAIDPLPELAAICKEQNVWFHVDGAYGAFAALTDRGRSALRGIELADSVTLDPHKWLYQPYECGCLLVRDGPLLRRAFEIAPDYLKDVTVNNEVNFVNLGMQLSRMTRALKVWMSIKYFGLDAYRQAIDHSIDLALHAQDRIGRSTDFELLCPAALSVVCFRRRFSDTQDEVTIEQRNRSLVRGLEATGEAWLSSTQLRGCYAIRICVLNHNTQLRHVDRALDWLEFTPIERLPDAPTTEAEYQRHPDLHRGRSVDGGAVGNVAPASALATLPLFREVPPALVARLTATAREVHLSSGERIVEQWDYGRDFFVILEGSAVVERDGEILNTLQAGDHFGELAALDWGAGFGYPRLASVTATTPVSLLVVPGEALNALLGESPLLAARIQDAVRHRLPGL